MAAEIIEIHPKNPENRKIVDIVKQLKKGAVIIYPTDTVYAIGCDLYHPKAVERVCKLKSAKPEKMNLTFICHDMSDISKYVLNLETPIFKTMKSLLPGPYAFILKATGEVPRILGVKKKTVGIRIPNHPVPQQIVAELGNPLVTTSIKSDDLILEYTTDPNEIFEDYKNLVDIIIDSGTGGNVPSTVLNASEGGIELVRQGLGKWDD